jgi:putative MFS transporter
MLYEMIFPVGLMAAGQIGTLLVPLYGWKILFLVGGIPGLILAFLVARLPESPRWLIGRGRLDEAQAIIARAEDSARRKYPDFPAFDPAAHVSPSAMPSGSLDRSRWRELLSPVYRRRTLVAWGLWASAYFIANGLNNWMPTLYHSLYQLPLGEALRAASMNNVAQVALLLVCAFCIDRLGRRAWALACFVGGALLLAILGFGGARSLTMLISLATLTYGILGSINAVLYLYTPEIYPTRMRAIGTGLSTSWLRIASAAGPPLVGLLVERHGISAVFIMFTGVAVLGALFAFSMIETGGRQLEDIAK